jgi:hypothetical protein
MTDTADVDLYGDFEVAPPSCSDFLTLNFTLSDENRMQRWSNYGLSADFLGDYFSAFFPGSSLESAPISRRDEVKAAVSFVANELIENAVKYGDQTDEKPITITIRLYKDSIIFEASNPSNTEHVTRYKGFAAKLLTGDPEQLYFEQLEQTALGSGQSQMGILTMVNDYEARFGWRFTPLASEGKWIVSVMVHLGLGEADVAG